MRVFKTLLLIIIICAAFLSSQPEFSWSSLLPAINTRFTAYAQSKGWLQPNEIAEIVLLRELSTDPVNLARNQVRLLEDMTRVTGCRAIAYKSGVPFAAMSLQRTSDDWCYHNVRIIDTQVQPEFDLLCEAYQQAILRDALWMGWYDDLKQPNNYGNFNESDSSSIWIRSQEPDNSCLLISRKYHATGFAQVWTYGGVGIMYASGIAEKIYPNAAFYNIKSHKYVLNWLRSMGLYFTPAIESEQMKQLLRELQRIRKMLHILPYAVTLNCIPVWVWGWYLRKNPLLLLFKLLNFAFQFLYLIFRLLFVYFQLQKQSGSI